MIIAQKLAENKQPNLKLDMGHQPPDHEVQLV